MANTTPRLSLNQPEMADDIDDTIQALFADMAKIDAAASKCNFAATVAPTANDDSSKGYMVGSFWFDTVALALYVCFNASIGAAVWKQISLVP